MTSLTSVPLQVYCSPRLGLWLLNLLKPSVSLLLILDTLHICDCLTQRLWHFNHNFRLNDLTHCADIFSSGKNPWSYVMSGTFVHVFPKRENCLYFTTISFYRIDICTQILCPCWILWAQPTLSSFTSPFPKIMVLYVHYQDSTWILTTVCWTWLGFSPHFA